MKDCLHSPSFSVSCNTDGSPNLTISCKVFICFTFRAGFVKFILNSFNQLVCMFFVVCRCVCRPVSRPSTLQSVWRMFYMFRRYYFCEIENYFNLWFTSLIWESWCKSTSLETLDLSNLEHAIKCTMLVKNMSQSLTSKSEIKHALAISWLLHWVYFNENVAVKHFKFSLMLFKRWQKWISLYICCSIVVFWLLIKINISNLHWEYLSRHINTYFIFCITVLIILGGNVYVRQRRYCNGPKKQNQFLL